MRHGYVDDQTYLGPSLCVDVEYLHCIVTLLFDIGAPQDEYLGADRVGAHACLGRLEGGHVVPVREGLLRREHRVQGLSCQVSASCQSTNHIAAINQPIIIRLCTKRIVKF